MMNPNETYLQLVLTKLEEAIGRLNASISRGEQEIQAMNEYYWDNYTEMDEYGYENYDNQKALFGQMTVTNSQLDLKHRYQKMLYSPYFGRVDFRFEDEEEAESFHIGIGNFSEAPGMTPLIYDWRAPISSLFYDYDRGPASFEAPAGLISGDITSKWQYKIRRGKMIYAFESDVKIDDEILKAELGKNGDVHLKNIVRTIQREQNAIIRNTKDRILIVQGCAGSGKTSVALHRIAYLLYHDRKRLTFTHTNPEALQIHFPHGALADMAVAVVTVRFLVVSGIVLDRNAFSRMGLHTVRDCRGKIAADQRVL